MSLGHNNTHNNNMKLNKLFDYVSTMDAETQNSCEAMLIGNTLIISDGDSVLTDEESRQKYSVIAEETPMFKDGDLVYWKECAYIYVCKYGNKGTARVRKWKTDDHIFVLEAELKTAMQQAAYLEGKGLMPRLESGPVVQLTETKPKFKKRDYAFCGNKKVFIRMLDEEGEAIIRDIDDGDLTYYAVKIDALQTVEEWEDQNCI